jgi:hypothetical protein
VSKYLTLLVIYNQFPAFKQAYDAGQASDTDAVHLGKLVRQVGKDPELVERVLGRGLRFGMENEVNNELKAHERREARAKVIADLEAHGVILAPDDWRSTGARRLAVLDVDPEGHRSEPCHAVWVDGAGEAEPICMNPDRHTDRPAGASSATGTKGGPADSSPGVERTGRFEAPAFATPTTSGTAPAAGRDDPATQEAKRQQQEEKERRARLDAERREREEAERARAADLDVAASKRHETLQTWLTSSGKLPRPLSDGYLFWQVVNLLAVELGDSSPPGALLDHAKKGPEQLRRVATGLVITWAEDRLRSEENWVDPFIHEHYRLLSDLGYQPSEVETEELARVGAAEPPDGPGEDAAEQGDS